MTDAEDWGLLSLVMAGKIYDVPGLVESIEGCERTQLWIVQKGIDASFAFTIWRGAQLQESVKITLGLANPQIRDAYIDLGRQLSPVWGTKKPTSMMPVNAAFGAAGITRIGIRTWGTPKPSAGCGWRAVLDVIEYRKMRRAPVGPPDPPKKESENDRLEKEFSNLKEKAATYGNPLSNPFK
jgi:hypothetical protein